MACCKNKTKSRKTWCIFTLISALVLCGAAVYLYLSVQEVVKSLSCAFVNMFKLSNAPASSPGQSVATQYPTQLINILAQMAPYLDFASMGPAIISAVLLLFCAILGYGLCGERSFCCAKFFVWLTELVLILTFAWYVVVAGAGLLSDRPVFTDQWAQLTSVCTQNLPTMQQALDDATADLATAQSSGASAGQIATAQAQLDQASTQYADFEALCGCLDEVPVRLKDVPGAGIMGLVATFLAFFCVNGLCCATGCCKKPKTGLRIAPKEDDPLPSKRDPNEEGYDDDVYEQDVSDRDLIRN